MSISCGPDLVGVIWAINLATQNMYSPRSSCESAVFDVVIKCGQIICLLSRKVAATCCVILSLDIVECRRKP